jgi:hypothetical protein
VLLSTSPGNVFGGGPQPHLFLYLFLFKEKRQKWIQNSTGLNLGEFICLLNKCLKCLNFFLLTLFIYVCSFYHGKFGMMGNLAG